MKSKSLFTAIIIALSLIAPMAIYSQNKTSSKRHTSSKAKESFSFTLSDIYQFTESPDSKFPDISFRPYIVEHLEELGFEYIGSQYADNTDNLIKTFRGHGMEVNITYNFPYTVEMIFPSVKDMNKVKLEAVKKGFCIGDSNENTSSGTLDFWTLELSMSWHDKTLSIFYNFE